MSGYQGRPGPNVSQLLNELNSTGYDGDFMNEESLSDDLNMFINTEFTNYDIPPLPSNTFEMGDSIDGFDNTTFEAGNTQSSPVYTNYRVPIQPAPPAGSYAVDNNLASPMSPNAAANGAQTRRAVDANQPPNVSADEKAKLAAEEDKRRRNTAASARFRIKKKQREQTLEKTVKEVTDKNSQLEAKMNELELENKWLKKLITEKNDNQSKEEIAAAYKKFRKESEERDVMNEATEPVSAR